MFEKVKQIFIKNKKGQLLNTFHKKRECFDNQIQKCLLNILFRYLIL